MGTTGEAPTLDDSKVDEIIATTIQAADGRVPVLFGAGGTQLRKLCVRSIVWTITMFRACISMPYYNRLTEDELRKHFAAMADATDR